MQQLFTRAAIVAAVAAVAAALVPAVAGAQSGADYRLHKSGLWVPPSQAEGPMYDILIERVNNNVSPRKNIAALAWQEPGTKPIHVITAQSERYPKGGEQPLRPAGHAEYRLIKLLRRMRIPLDWVFAGASELRPCMLPGAYCERQLRSHLPNLRDFYYGLEYGDTKASRRLGVRQLHEASMELRRRLGEVKSIMNPPGGRGGGAAARTFIFPPSAPGGIDFSSLELRYVADTGSGPRGLRYAFRGLEGEAAPDPDAGLHAARQSSDAFFTWLALPPQSFWVNLNPNQPDRILDPQLARTDAGRVLLEADLQLKKTAVGLINPDTPTGDAFWDELEAIYGERALESCITFRVWIVPAPATVRETGDELYILDAPLTVRMESELIPDPAAGNPGCPLEDAATEERKEGLFRRLILPPVIRAINTAPEYAALRRVYLSRVAAEWFRRRSGERPTAVSKVVDSGKIDRWVARPGWDPFEVYNRFLRSFREGEWTATRGERTLIYGGVDFSRTPRRKVTRRQFERRWPRLSRQAHRSQRRPVAQGDEVWLGGGSGREATRAQRVRQPPRVVRPPRQPEPCGAATRARARARAAC